MTPPWPGSRVPMSLSSRSRLIMDSLKSPSVAKAGMIAPKTSPVQNGAPMSVTARIVATAAAKIVDPR